MAYQKRKFSRIPLQETKEFFVQNCFVRTNFSGESGLQPRQDLSARWTVIPRAPCTYPCVTPMPHPVSSVLISIGEQMTWYSHRFDPKCSKSVKPEQHPQGKTGQLSKGVLSIRNQISLIGVEVFWPLKNSNLALSHRKAWKTWNKGQKGWSEMHTHPGHTRLCVQAIAFHLVCSCSLKFKLCCAPSYFLWK